MLAQPEIKDIHEKGLAAGYIYSGGDEEQKSRSIIELEYWSTRYSQGIHYLGLFKYAGMEIGVNTERFTIGPKIGASISYGGFILGAESIVYTDFNEATLRIAPVWGFGTHKYQVSLSYQIGLINRSFEQIQAAQLNVSIRLFTLDRKER